jgi:hypothetical protein
MTMLVDFCVPQRNLSVLCVKKLFQRQDAKTPRRRKSKLKAVGIIPTNRMVGETGVAGYI